MEKVTAIDEQQINSPAVTVVDTNYLSAEDILNADDLIVYKTTVPEWPVNGKPGVLCFKPMTGDEVKEFRSVGEKDPEAKTELWLRIFARCVCKPDGSQMFREAQLVQLRKKNAAVFLRLQEKFLVVNGMARATKSLEQVKEMLVALNAEAPVIAGLQALWQSPEELVKNA